MFTVRVRKETDIKALSGCLSKALYEHGAIVVKGTGNQAVGKALIASLMTQRLWKTAQLDFELCSIPGDKTTGVAIDSVNVTIAFPHIKEQSQEGVSVINHHSEDEEETPEWAM